MSKVIASLMGAALLADFFWKTPVAAQIFSLVVLIGAVSLVSWRYVFHGDM